MLAVEKTPLTRQERQEIIRQITDDILGYGPLEPFLRDDSVTEVMVNDRQDSTSSATASSPARTPSSSTRPHLLRIIDKIISRIGRRIDESSPMSTRACPTARA